MDFAFFLAKADSTVEEIPTADSTTFKEFFSEYRKRKVRRPDVLIKRGLPALKKSGHEGVDLWSLLEALFLAAVDVGDKSLASMCLERLTKEFPESVRVGILKGRKLEMEGQLAAAMTLYESLLEKQMQNVDVMRRMVCVHKQSGNTKLAVERLHALLAVYQADTAAWNELSEIHLAHGNYALAAHCYEELVMLKPTSSLYHNRLADAYYSIGDEDHVRLARKHYTLSLEQQSYQINLHAVYGLQASARWLSEISNTSQVTNTKKNNNGNEGNDSGSSKNVNDLGAAPEQEVNAALLQYATEKLAEMKLPTGAGASQ